MSGQLCPFERRGVRMGSHRRPASTLLEKNLGAGPEISECDLVATGSKCGLRIEASRAVSILGGTNICVLPEGYDDRCTSTHAPWRNCIPRTESRETSALSTVSECRFRIVVTYAILMLGRKVMASSFAEGVRINGRG
ncbi:hypothetical protein Taro_050007 [Colocasia esculenta]|uniref:Uncharacterized protein n=1 Tax=Colocasia esculenta TaxID=4460 RepID=A0A843XCQ2_COLES|nr:hypothetical protein [Colocasia esculenta]